MSTKISISNTVKNYLNYYIHSLIFRDRKIFGQLMTAVSCLAVGLHFNDILIASFKIHCGRKQMENYLKMCYSSNF